MSNEQLAEIIQGGRDRDGEYMSLLWQQSEAYVSKIANEYASFAEFDDLKQQGFLGICDAVDHFDPAAGVKFLTYAGYWIRESMLEYITDNSMTSASAYWQIVKMRRFVEEYERDHVEGPQNGDICAYMGITEDQLETLQNAENKMETASLDSPVDEGIDLADLMPGVDDPEKDVIDEVQNAELASTLWSLVDQLPEGQVLRKRYQQEKQLSEIAEEIGRTVSQVEGDQRRGLMKLRTEPRSREKLLPFWNDSRIRSAALQGNGVGSFNRTWSSSTEKTAIRMIEKNGK